ncbi:MAG: hypothetical protein J6A59_01660 [Lachnospiraceae bacterium]|nr:hypothetical protein [Lachnospiraceae bacterium]
MTNYNLLTFSEALDKVIKGETDMIMRISSDLCIDYIKGVILYDKSEHLRLTKSSLNRLSSLIRTYKDKAGNMVMTSATEIKTADILAADYLDLSQWKLFKEDDYRKICDEKTLID